MIGGVVLLFFFFGIIQGVWNFTNRFIAGNFAELSAVFMMSEEWNGNMVGMVIFWLEMVKAVLLGCLWKWKGLFFVLDLLFCLFPFLELSFFFLSVGVYEACCAFLLVMLCISLSSGWDFNTWKDGYSF